jgi:hypothetical protein
MKGIVADIKGKYAVVLGKDGSFTKVRNNGSYNIGCEIDIEKPAAIKTSLAARVAFLAAGALLVIGIGYGAYSYTVPYSIIDVDINPSLEITTNIYDRIIKAEALNEEGQKLLQAGSLKHSSLDKGVAVILNNAVRQGYLKGDAADNAVVFTIVSEDAKRSEKLRKGIETVAIAELKEEGVKSKVVVGKASRQEHDSAREIGLTQGKLGLIEKAIEAEPGLKLEDLRDVPVKDILKKVRENRKADRRKEDKKEDGKEDAQNKQKDSQGNIQDIRKRRENRQEARDSQGNRQDTQKGRENRQEARDSQGNRQDIQKERENRQEVRDRQDIQGRKDIHSRQQDKQESKRDMRNKQEDRENTDRKGGGSVMVTGKSGAGSGKVRGHDRNIISKTSNAENRDRPGLKKDF